MCKNGIIMMLFMLCLLVFSFSNNVLSESTEHECPNNEYWSQCLLGECRPMECGDLGFTQPCPGILPPCPQGCVCKLGYVRIKKHDICIPEEQCPSCGGDENAIKGDDRYCNNLCSNYNKKDGRCKQTWEDSYYGCKCKEGFVYDETTYKCVRPDECRLQN